MVRNILFSFTASDPAYAMASAKKFVHNKGVEYGMISYNEFDSQVFIFIVLKPKIPSNLRRFLRRAAQHDGVRTRVCNDLSCMDIIHRLSCKTVFCVNGVYNPSVLTRTDGYA